MAERRRRHLRRDLLIFAGSIVVHIGVFFIAAAEFSFYNLPQQQEAAVQVEIVPPTVEPIPPLPPIVTPKVAPTAKAAAPAPTPPAPPPPTPQPPRPTPAPPQPVATPTAAAQAVRAPTPAPTPKPAPTPAPLAPPSPAPTPGPPKAVPKSSVSTPETHSAATPHIVLHRSRDEGAPLTSGLNLPGATFAPAPQASAPGGGGAPGGPGGGASGLLPGGQLPAFGRGLRGGVLGCANAAVLHLSAAEQARCDEAFGEGARESPRMDAIDASKRGELDRESTAQEAARKYRDSMPAGSSASPQPGQPKILQSPAQ